MAVRSEKDKTIAVLSDAAAGMDEHVVADQRKLNRGARTDIAVPADPDIGADHDPRTDHRPGADFDIWTDHGKRIDDHAIFQMRRGIDDGGRRYAGEAEPGLRPQGVAVQRARDLDEFAEWMGRAQNRDMGGDASLETLVDHAGS